MSILSSTIWRCNDIAKLLFQRWFVNFDRKNTPISVIESILCALSSKMKVLLKIIYESIVQAFQSLVGNKLRTFLSLLGITIGIFCIISVLSAVDSLETSIKSGFNELGSDVIYVQTMPWNEDPGRNYWKYAKRPEPSFKDYTAILDKTKLSE